MSRLIRSVTEMLGLLSRGRFAEKCDEHLQHAIQSLESLPDGRGKATLTITLDIAFQEGRLDVTPAVKSKLPEDKGFTGTPFWALEGALSVQHPSQFDMFGPRAASDREDRGRDAG